MRLLPSLRVLVLNQGDFPMKNIITTIAKNIVTAPRPILHPSMRWGRSLKSFICMLVGGMTLLALSGHANANANPTGTWIAEVNGNRLILELRADGSGSLNGDPGSWQLRGAQLILANPAGEAVTAHYNRNQISVTIEGVHLIFVRQGRASQQRMNPEAKVVSTTSSKPFVPKRTVAAKMIHLGKGLASCKVPSGWRHGWSKDQESYALVPNNGELRGKSMVGVTRRLLSAQERRQPMSALLIAGANELLGETRAQIAVGPESFTVNGARSGRLIGRGQISGIAAEFYLGAVIVESWAIVVISVYPQSAEATMRASMDTVLASMKAKAPKPNLQFARKIAGCWELYQNDSDIRTGHAYTQSSYRFNRNGSYTYRYNMSVSSGGGSVSDSDTDAGTWEIYGGTLFMQSEENGVLKELDVRFQRSRLIIEGRRYLPCG